MSRPLTRRGGGVLLGYGADLLLADPVRWHPVAGFGRGARRLERAMYRDSIGAGVWFTALAVVGPAALMRVPLFFAVWASLGGTSLAREGERLAGLLGAADLPGARARLTYLCARDPAGLSAEELARATVESLAENTSDAMVAPLFWAAVAGVPGVVAYRCINTLDAMVGYRNSRYQRFGRASARLDDLANLIPSRLTAILACVLAPAVGGSTRRAWTVWRRDGSRHPSPNAGQCEAAFAGALDIRLGGDNVYHGAIETRDELGDGSAPGVGDIARAVRLSRLVGLCAAVLAFVARR